MSKIIIGIHGLGNKPPEKILVRWWKNAIHEGLKAIGHPRMFIKFELVYWSNFLHPESLNPKEKNKKHPLYIEYPYTPAKEFVKKKPSNLRKKVLNILEKQLDKLLLNEDMSINFSSITDLIIHHFFKDLDIYYTTNCVDKNKSDCLAKEVIREQLVRILKKHRRKDILLIAHSMGSIIAYDVLTQYVPNIKIDTFVTVGSPLGIPVIMSKINSEQKNNIKNENKLRTPNNVLRNWYNFSDLEDRVAINYNLSDDYDENLNHVRAIDTIVHNNYEYDGHRNPHKSYGYLRTPEFSEVIYDFLNHDKIKIWIKISDKMNKLFSKLFN